MTSGTGLSRLNDDEASFNDRMSQPTKERQVESASCAGRPRNGSKSPVIGSQPSSLPDLNAQDGFHRVSSNPLEIRKSVDHKAMSGRGSSHQRRTSLSHHPPPLSSYGREHEGGSRGDDRGSYRRAETGDFGQHSQQNIRPGEMRYTDDDQHDIRE